MLDFLKKPVAFMLGAAMLTGDKLREFADEAVERGEMSKDEARKFIDDVTKRADEEKRGVQSWMREQATKIMREVGCAEAHRVEELEKRVEELEKRAGVAAGVGPGSVEMD